MEFEWDNAKAKANARKRSVPFAYAARVFLDSKRVTAPDVRQDYGEVRLITMGMIEKRLFVVTYTMRGKIIRLISARKGNTREQKYYQISSRS